MNKELIKKYKVEFDHWLNGGKLQVKFVNDPWEEAPKDIFSYSMVNFMLVIDDEYIKFRKALAEGKTIQCNAKEGENDITYTAYGHTWWEDTTEFKYATTFYRVKPEELKFKVGDWITDGIEVWQHKENCRVKNQTSWSLWKPKPGEWCWVFNYLREIPNLRRVIKVEANFTNRFDDEKFTKAVRVSRGDDLNDEVGYRFCEPFIGQLPTSIENYKKE